MDAPRLYFSHPTHEFGDEAHALDTELRMRGFREGGFIDVKGSCMTKGSMKRSIRQCSIFVILLTSRTLESRWMQLELSDALYCQKPIAPLVHEQDSLDGYNDFLDKLFSVLLQNQHIDPTITWEDFRGRFPQEPIVFKGRIGSPERDEMFRQILVRGSDVYPRFLTQLKLHPLQVLVVGHPTYAAGPCKVIALELCHRGFGAIGTNHEWFQSGDVIPDVRTDELSLVVFLTQKCWEDSNVVARVRIAIARGTPMMFFIEKDRSRKGWCSIENAVLGAPDDIRPIFDDIHIIGFSYDSRSTFLEVTLDHIQDSLSLKTFAVFLSHHKGGAKSEVRLIKDRLYHKLVQDNADYKNVFLDVDNALRLDELEDYVKASKVLVLLLTNDVLTRPWVLVELTSALLWKIPIVTVHFAIYDFSKVRSALANISPQCEEILRSNFPETPFEEIQYLLETAPIGMILSQEYDSMSNDVTLELFIERLSKRIRESAYVSPVISRLQWHEERVRRMQALYQNQKHDLVLSMLLLATFATGIASGLLLCVNGWQLPAPKRMDFFRSPWSNLFSTARGSHKLPSA